MVRSAALLGAFVGLLFCLTFVPSAGSLGAGANKSVIDPQPTRVITFKSYDAPLSLHADGSRVAIQFYESVELWDVASGLRIHALGGCDTAVMDVALAGRRVASVCLEDTMSLKGIHIGVVYPHVAVVPSPEQPCQDGWSGLPRYPCAWFLDGHDDVIVFNVLTRNDRALWRIDRDHRTLLRIGHAAGLIRSVSSGQIAVEPDSSSVLILDRAGRTRRIFRFTAGERQVALAPRHLVTLDGGHICLYRLTDGRLEHDWPVDDKARLLDTTDTLGVYLSRGTIHILRYADGRDFRLLLRARNNLLAQIEDAGLYYAFKRFPQRRSCACRIPARTRTRAGNALKGSPREPRMRRRFWCLKEQRRCATARTSNM